MLAQTIGHGVSYPPKDMEDIILVAGWDNVHSTLLHTEVRDRPKHAGIAFITHSFKHLTYAPGQADA